VSFERNFITLYQKYRLPILLHYLHQQSLCIFYPQGECDFQLKLVVSKNFSERGFLMDEKMRLEIALFRFSVIGVLVSGELTHGELSKKIADLSTRRYSIPYSHRTHIGAGTIEDWLYAYRYNGLEGLKPKNRSDQGCTRMIEALLKTIIEYRNVHRRMPLRLVIIKLQAEHKLPAGEYPLSTVYRYLRRHTPKRAIPVTGRVQKRFAHRFPNDCWQGDVMHGHYVNDADGKAKKTYLIAIIDDCSRLIVAASFFFSEATVNVKEVLRSAVLTYGVPDKLFLDNGKNFCAEDIQIACATMKCALIHSTPYYPEGKGKIERFFRTVRDCFLSALPKVKSLQELNSLFNEWLMYQYNRVAHSSLEGATPLDTFLAKAENRIRRLGAQVDSAELFCKKETRIVAKDGTFRINNVLYEAEEQLIGCKITVLYDKDDPAKKVKVFDGPQFVHCATPIDVISNASARRKEINSKED
jgi:transposase InsO family protein